MPPGLAMLACIILILFFLKKDFAKDSKPSYTLLIPLVWFTIFASRTVDQWMDLGAEASLLNYEMGDANDRIIFSSLIILGLLALMRRGISWSLLFKGNVWIFLWFLLCGVSILWSDFPGIAAKRWIKGVGTLIMAVIVITEGEEGDGIGKIIRRCAYILLPLSVVFIKYFPELGGVGYDPWGNGPFFSGVTQTKNHLGRLCMISGLYFFWAGKKILQDSRGLAGKMAPIVISIIACWLLFKANSKTAITGFFVGILVLFMLKRLQALKMHRMFGMCIGAALMILLSLQFGLGINIFEDFTSALGRDKTLTGRTELWEDLWNMKTNPIIGVGYDSFWIGERVRTLWNKWWWRPNEAHNGYFEIYLELGIVGLLFFGMMLVATYRKIIKTMDINFDQGKFKMVIFLVFILFNLTEASAKGVQLVWTLFLFVSLEYPQRKIQTDRDDRHYHFGEKNPKVIT